MIVLFLHLQACELAANTSHWAAWKPLLLHHAATFKHNVNDANHVFIKSVGAQCEDSLLIMSIPALEVAYL